MRQSNSIDTVGSQSKAMKRFVVLPIFAAMLLTKPAGAVALFGNGKPVLVHEDYVILHYDDTTKRVHVLLAARMAPAFARIRLGLPTPSAPKIGQLVIDLPDALHKLITPHEMRLRKTPPAPPALWNPEGARLDSFVLPGGSADRIFDAAWLQSYVDKGFSIAVGAINTPEDERIEIVSPTIHISYESERLGLARREPPLPIQGEDEPGADVPEKPRLPVTIAVSKVEPKQLGLTSESMAAIWGKRPGALLECYEAFLERKPDAATTVNFSATIRPKGDVVGFKALEPTKDPAGKKLESCVEKVLRTKQLPARTEGYEVRAQVVFTPPHVPARRTHIVTIGSSKYVWRNMPASVRLEHDFEVLPLDLKLAMRDDVRKALNLRNGERVWISHWLDRSARRTSAEDIEFERQDLPARGEPGALALEGNDADLDRPKHAKKVAVSQTISRKRRNALLILGVLVVSLAGALGIAVREMRG